MAKLRKKHQEYGDFFFLDEVLIKTNEIHHYLWWKVDQNGEVVDVLLPKHRVGKAAKRFYKRLLKKNLGEHRKIVKDKMGNYGNSH